MKNKNAVKPLKKGSKVEWIWMGRAVKGAVKQIFFRPVKKVLRDSSITRNGSNDNSGFCSVFARLQQCTGCKRRNRIWWHIQTCSRG